ncbi:hypothetical protein [Hyphomicrobium sp. DY-1]|uniref:hypothetical protein n=1 Tax=Hyphomicrobium sp. DY-1 TaxID=3075650 RepID=UPI0039C0893D
MHVIDRLRAQDLARHRIEQLELQAKKTAQAAASSVLRARYARAVTKLAEG